MALFCGDVGIASVGVSCQAAMQLDQNKDFIGSMLGADPQIHITPFDWMVCHPSAAAKMISEDRYFPHDLTEFDLSRLQPKWTRMGQCFYWHEQSFRSYPERTRDKFAHTSETFRALRSSKRRIFILANTQNNLPDVNDKLGGFDYALDDAHVEQLRASLDAIFGRSELWAVSYPCRHTISRYRDILFEIEPDQSAVRGSERQWRAVFSRILNYSS